MSQPKFVYADNMVEGTPTLGVVYYLLKERLISIMTGLEPMGYIVVEEEKDQEEKEEV